MGCWRGGSGEIPAVNESPRLSGLPPLVTGHTRMLVLGSFPGVTSLARQQYYAHPHNAFWRLLQALWPASPMPGADQYQQRVAQAGGLARAGDDGRAGLTGSALLVFGYRPGLLHRGFNRLFDLLLNLLALLPHLSTRRACWCRHGTGFLRSQVDRGDFGELFFDQRAHHGHHNEKTQNTKNCFHGYFLTS